MAQTRVFFTPDEFKEYRENLKKDYVRDNYGNTIGEVITITTKLPEPIIVEPVFKFKVVDLNESELAKCNTIEEGVKIFLERRPYFTREHAELFVEKL